MVSVDKGESGRVFISYRRQETAWPARQLHDVLAAELGANRIFKDVDDIEPGDDFVERIQSAVGSCQVLLALIGPQWLTVTDAKGARRIDDPADFVRLEVETALSRDDVRVIPILVDHAKMPTAEELPAGLAALTRRQAVEINPVSFDTHRLLRVLNETLNAAADAPAAPRKSGNGQGIQPAAVPPAAPPVESPMVAATINVRPSAPAIPRSDRAEARRRPLMLGVGVISLVLLLAIGVTGVVFPAQSWPIQRDG